MTPPTRPPRRRPAGTRRVYATRWLEPEDAAGLQDVVRLVGVVSATDPLMGFPSMPSATQARTLTERLGTGLRSGGSWVVTCTERSAGLVGCAALHRPAAPNQAHIGELATGAVHPEHRATGVAALKLRAIAARCRREGVSLLRLDVRAGMPAERIWRGFGFSEYGRLEDYGRIGTASYAGVFLAQRVADLVRRLDPDESQAGP